jgi:hypothetical protein
VNAFQIGETQWKDIYVGLSDLSGWRNAGDDGSKEFDGMLGPGILAPQGVIIDFTTLKLWFPAHSSTRRNGWD